MRSIGHGQAGPPQRLDLGRRAVEAPGDGHGLVVHQGARGMGAPVALVHGAGGDDDVVAAPGQCHGGAAADAPAGAGHDGDPAGLRPITPSPVTYIIPAIWCPPSTWSTWPFT